MISLSLLPHPFPHRPTYALSLSLKKIIQAQIRAFIFITHRYAL